MYWLVKPIVIFTVDGGPDENPRYQKVIQIAIHHFINHSSDCFFVETNNPGRSAFYRVERKMAPLNKSLVVLFRPMSILEASIVVAVRLILKHTGKVLAKVWSNLVIDKYPCVTEYINPA